MKHVKDTSAVDALHVLLANAHSDYQERLDIGMDAVLAKQDVEERLCQDTAAVMSEVTLVEKAFCHFCDAYCPVCPVDLDESRARGMTSGGIFGSCCYDHSSMRHSVGPRLVGDTFIPWVCVATILRILQLDWVLED